jgi:hypothetical protein
MRATTRIVERSTCNRDGVPWLQHAALGGTRVQLASGPDVTYQVAAQPSSPRDARLLALDADEHLIAVDVHSGPTNLPRLRASAAVSSLVLASDVSAGRFRLYANDATDHDGDGLGRRLERAISRVDAVAAAQRSRRSTNASVRATVIATESMTPLKCSG